MSKWANLHCHSFFSLLDGLSKPNAIADRCAELGYESCAVTDHGNISACVAFTKAMKKKNIKPILGSEFYLCQQAPDIKSPENRYCSHLVVLSKNLKGWQRMIAATSRANSNEYVYYNKPRLNLDTLAEYAGDLMTFSGHIGSDMADVLFESPKLAYAAKSKKEAISYLHKDWAKRAIALAGKYAGIFGKDNFYLEVQLIDVANLPAQQVVTEALRWVSKKTGIPCVATADSHYCRKEDAADQRVLLVNNLGTTLKTVQSKLDDDADVGLGGFFRSNNYHIPSYDEMVACGHTEEELRNAVKIAAACEDINILGQCMLPQYPCPDGKTPDVYLTELCRAGWKEKLPDLGSRKQEYVDRINKELGVVKEAGLSSYFLIVQDYMNFANSKGFLTGPGRGSGAGCLISYLLGITKIDPIPYNLLFERFYNAGRNSPGRISMPDIDCDFPKYKREEVIEYIKNKYGHGNVAHMVTFSRMQGRGGLKDVLRAHEACSFDEMNRITAHIPDEAEISDQLQVMREENDGEASIIRWALENNADELREWCHLDDKGEIQGPFSPLFKQAIRLEGVKKSQGKHASGIIISTVPLNTVCPMVFDKNSDDPIAGLEMNDLEALNMVKFDILGVSALDKCGLTQEMVRNGC